MFKKDENFVSPRLRYFTNFRNNSGRQGNDCNYCNNYIMLLESKTMVVTKWRMPLGLHIIIIILLLFICLCMCAQITSDNSVRSNVLLYTYIFCLYLSFFIYHLLQHTSKGLCADANSPKTTASQSSSRKPEKIAVSHRFPPEAGEQLSLNLLHPSFRKIDIDWSKKPDPMQQVQKVRSILCQCSWTVELSVDCRKRFVRLDFEFRVIGQLV